MSRVEGKWPGWQAWLLRVLRGVGLWVAGQVRWFRTEPVGSSPSAPGNLLSVANRGFISAFKASNLLGKDSQGSSKCFVPPEKRAQGCVGTETPGRRSHYEPGWGEAGSKVTLKGRDEYLKN